MIEGTIGGVQRVDPVQGQVVAARTQVDVVFVGLPHDLESQQVTVEPEGPVEIAHAESQVTHPEAIERGFHRKVAAQSHSMERRGPGGRASVWHDSQDAAILGGGD